MTGKFRLERVGADDAADEETLSGFGPFALFGNEAEYRFRTEDMSLEEAELYIHHVLNQLPEPVVDELCKQACEWKNAQLSANTADYPARLAEAQGRSILEFMSVGEVHLYRNPYDRDDPVFGAIVSGGADWDSENGMEIVLRGSRVLEVREYLGYGEFAIWD